MTSSKKQLMKITNCPECGNDDIIEDSDLGEIICHNCGLVISWNMIDRGPEWRAFTKEERDKRGRVGLPTSFSIHDKGLSTVIEGGNRDSYGRKLSSDRRLDMLNLRRWQIRTRVYSSIERNLAQAMAELDRIADKLYIPSFTKEKAAIIYRKVLDKGLVRGRSIDAISAASLYLACRSSEIPRTLKEVAAISRVRKRDVARFYRLLLRELDLKMPVEDPIKCVSKIASRIGVSMQIQRRSLEILRKAKLRGIVSGKNPMGLASAALYVSGVLEGEIKTQKEIAEVANVTEVTVRNRYKHLKESLGRDIY